MIYQADPIIETRIRGRRGEYTIRVYDLAGRTHEVQHVQCTGTVLQAGKRSRGYGQLVRRSYMEMTLRFLPRRVRDLWTGPFEETRFPVTIEGPGVQWRGLVKRGRRTRPIDTRQGPDEMRITAYDGLKRLDDIDPEPFFFRGSLSEVLASVLGPMQKGPSYGTDVPVALRWSGTITGVAGTAYTPSSYRHDSAPLPPLGEEDSKMERLNGILEDLGAVCYMSSERGRVEVVPREELGAGGTAVAVHESNDQQQRVTMGLPSRTEAVQRPRTEDSDEWETLEKAGAVDLTFEDDYNLLLDPTFAESIGMPVINTGYERYQPLWWTVNDKTNVTAAEGGVMLGVREYHTATDGSIDATDDASGDGTVTRDVMRLGPQGYGAPLDYPSLAARLTCTIDSPSYMPASGSGTATLTHGTRSSSATAQNGGYGTVEVILLLDDSTAVLGVELSGDDVRVSDVQLQLLLRDSNGDELVVSTLRVGDESAEAVEVEHRSTWWRTEIAGEEQDGGDVVVVGPTSDGDGTISYAVIEDILCDYVQWNSETYYHPSLLAVARRLAQQTLGTENVETQVQGVQGPSVRLSWDEGDVETIPVGRKMDLFAGRTELTDITIPTDL